MRILHFSDVHLRPRLGRVPFTDWFSKRATGAANFLWQRRGQFASVPYKPEKLAAFAREHAVDAILYTGDYTFWGTEHEYVTARAAVQPIIETVETFVTVPGNHDIYTHRVLRTGCFLRHFGDLLESDAPESADDGPWPLVRWLGREAVVIALNSAVPPRTPWRASGRIPPRQLAALSQVIRDPRIHERFVFVMTHHAPRLADWEPDSARRGLENSDDFLDVCANIPRGAIVFGHVHRCYTLRVPRLPVDLFNSGSATMFRNEGLWVFDVESGSLTARRGGWAGNRYALEPA